MSRGQRQRQRQRRVQRERLIIMPNRVSDTFSSEATDLFRISNRNYAKTYFAGATLSLGDMHVNAIIWHFDRKLGKGKGSGIQGAWVPEASSSWMSRLRGSNYKLNSDEVEVFHFSWLNKIKLPPDKFTCWLRWGRAGGDTSASEASLLPGKCKDLLTYCQVGRAQQKARVHLLGKCFIWLSLCFSFSQLVC